MSVSHLLMTAFYKGSTCVATATVPCVTTDQTQSVKNITANLQAFIGPILLFAIGAISLSFLMKKEMKKFIQFIVLAIAVAVVFYTPDVIINISKIVAALFGGSSTAQ